MERQEAVMALGDTEKRRVSRKSVRVSGKSVRVSHFGL
jgi:hypothetical protein